MNRNNLITLLIKIIEALVLFILVTIPFAIWKIWQLLICLIEYIKGGC
jgi:hypothetical protein